MLVHSIVLLFLLTPTAMHGQSPSSAVPDVEMVKRALDTELREATNPGHPMRYRLRRSTPRLTTTKEICESKDGAVARLVEINDQPLSRDDEEKEQARLTALLNDSNRQRHRKESQDNDTRRILKVLRALPSAFIYQYAGTGIGPSGTVERFTFSPNRTFNAQDVETLPLTEMTGEIWIDASQGRVTRLEGHLQDDVDFGWGILGRMYKGGWIVIEQAEVAPKQWRIVRIQLKMTGRLLFANKSFDTLQEQTHFSPVPAGLNYVQAIHLLRSSRETAAQGTTPAHLR